MSSDDDEGKKSNYVPFDFDSYHPDPPAAKSTTKKEKKSEYVPFDFDSYHPESLVAKSTTKKVKKSKKGEIPIIGPIIRYFTKGKGDKKNVAK